MICDQDKKQKAGFELAFCFILFNSPEKLTYFAYCLLKTVTNTLRCTDVNVLHYLPFFDF